MRLTDTLFPTLHKAIHVLLTNVILPPNRSNGSHIYENAGNKAFCALILKT
jgi:hypothetical protein